jgi:peptide/nickel transport system substrate-binding protein
MKYRSRLAVRVLGALALISGATGALAQDDQAGVCEVRGGTANIGMWSITGNFLPHYSVSNYEKYIGNLVFHSLYAYDEDLELIPRLAASTEVDEAGTTYTITLRDNVLWHDGTPFTANDVAFTYRLMLHPEYDGTRTSNLMSIKGAAAYRAGEADDVEGIVVVDDHTIQITTEYPDAVFMEAVGKELWILPEHILGDVPPAEVDAHDLARNPVVGTGPFQFTRYAEGQFIEFTRFDDYFLGQPCLDSVVVKIVSPSVALAQLQTGELDITAGTGIGSLEPRDVEYVNEIPGVEPVVYTTSSIQVLNIALRKPYLQDARVRQAFAHAIDRQALVDYLLLGYGEAANGPLNSEDYFYNPDQPIYEYDPQKARQLLEEAGWDFSRTLVLMYPTGNRVRELSAPVIQANLQAIGVNVELSLVDFAAQTAAARDGIPDMWLSGSYLPLFDPQTILYSWHSSQVPPAGYNLTYFQNERVDEILDSAGRTLDRDERSALYDELQVILATELPVVPLYYAQSIDAVSDRLKNAHPGPWDATWNLHTWYKTE